MRTRITRSLAVLFLLAASLAVGTVHALAENQASAICPAGQLGITLRWSDAEDALFCTVAAGVQAVPSEVVGLVVRGPDGGLSTVDIAPVDITPASIPVDASAARSRTADNVTAASSSRSVSNSSFTTCINGKCTTSSNHVICVNGSCSSQP